LKSRRFHGAAGLLASLLIVLVVSPALARNFRIAGGIQYVVQGGKERVKKNEEDARRIYGKAVTQLTMGIAEDPGDIEAWDYLGLAYAELDSAEKCGWAFGRGVELARAKPEEKKLLQRLQDNREHYWVRYFNEAIRTYQKAVEASPTGEPDSAAAMEAVVAMRQAAAVNPTNPKSFCNLGAFLANAKRYDEAIRTIDDGLKIAPQDSCLLGRREQLSVVAADKAAETGDWDKATAPFERMLAADPQDVGAALRLGEIYFKKGQALDEQAAKLADGPEKQAAMEQVRAAFSRSADGFGKYSELKPDDKDGRYNHAVALLRAEKYEDAGKVAIAGLHADPLSPEFHAALSSAYRGLKMVDPANGHTLMAKVLREGNKEADPAAAAKANAEKAGPASDAAKLLKELGPPAEIRTQMVGDFPVEGWFWPGAKRAVLMTKGRTVSDVSYAQLLTPPPPKAAAPKAGAKKPAAGAK
jgi:tetratricopeptide (TPR) repeat protein